jgi:uncharacterized protein with PIN domain
MPPVEFRFYCDEMLKRLGRWLRAAGYDTLINDGISDREMLQQAVREGRYLLTRDRKIVEFREANELVIVLYTNNLEQNIEELGKKLPIDWLHEPFSRCLIDNSPLIVASHEDWDQVPEDAKGYNDTLYKCPECGRLYWPGSHAKRMYRKLSAWQAI